MNINGDPGVLVRLNNTGSGGAFEVSKVVGPVSLVPVFRVDDTGLVTLHGKLSRDNAFVLDTTGGAIFAPPLLKLQQSGTDRLDVLSDDTDNFVRIKASTSGWALRLAGDSVELNASGATGPVRLRSGGTEYVTFTYDTSVTPTSRMSAGTGLVEIGGAAVELNATDTGGPVRLRSNSTEYVTFTHDTSGTPTSRMSAGTGLVEVSGSEVILNATGTTGPVRLRSAGTEYVTFKYDTSGTPRSIVSADTSELEVTGDAVYLNPTNATGNVQLLSDGEKYLSFTYDPAGDGAITLTSGRGVDASGILRLSAGVIVMRAAASVGVINYYVWGTTDRFNLSLFNDPLPAVDTGSVVFTSYSTGQGYRSIQHSSGRDVVALLDRNGQREATGDPSHFQVRFGTASTLLFQVANEDEGARFYGADTTSAYVQSAQITTVTGDALVDVGGTSLRARLKLNYGNGKPGVVRFEASTSSEWYFWADTDGLLRVKGIDPGSTGGGYAVGAKQRVVPVTASTYSVQPSECDTIFTNAGAGATVTFTLPAAAVGLRYLFVVAAGTKTLAVQRTGTDTFWTATGAATGPFDDAVKGTFISLVCFEGGQWLVDRINGFS